MTSSPCIAKSTAGQPLHLSARQRLVLTSQKLSAEHAVCMWHAQGMPLHVPTKDWACVIKVPFVQDRASSTPHHGRQLGQQAAASTNHLKGKHRAHHHPLLILRGSQCSPTAAELTSLETEVRTRDDNQLIHEPEAAAEEEEMPQPAVLVFSGGTAFNSVAGKPRDLLQHCV